MGMVLNTNIGAIQAQRALTESRGEMEKAMERLATGSRINSAADDAAGLAMVERMNSQIRGLQMATKNANDGIALIKTVENALVEVSGMLQRMRELAVQSANATNTATERNFSNNELTQLQQEISRVSANTRYNGTQVLNGTFSSKALQVGTMSGEEIRFNIDSVEASLLGGYVIEGVSLAPADAATTTGSTFSTAEDLTIVANGNNRVIDIEAADSAKVVATKINAVAGATTVFAQARTFAHLDSSSATSTSFKVEINGVETAAFDISSNDVADAVSKINAISGETNVLAAATTNNQVLLTNSTGEDITVANTTAGTTLVVASVGNDGITENSSSVALEASTGNNSTRVLGTVRLTSSEGFSATQASGTSNYFSTTDTDATAELVSVAGIDITTQLGASNAISIIDGALERVSGMRGGLGTLENRLSYSVSNLMKVTEYTIGARSRIADADFAAETSRLAKAQVLQQAGAAMLSQANASTNVVLQVLNG